MIRAFCGCEHSKKNIEPLKNFTGCYKKQRGSGLTSRLSTLQDYQPTEYIWKSKKSSSIAAKIIGAMQCEIYKLGSLEGKRSIR